MSKIEEMRVYAINECAKLYGFDASDALSKVSIKKTEKEKKDRGVIVPLPFVGMVNGDLCQGIKKNYGLYTQCEKKKTKNGEYCATCQKQAAKNENGEPNLGTIAKRVEEGWRDAKGRGPVNYRKVMKKLGLTEEQVMEEATRQGVELDGEKHFAEEVKRGRPKKEKAVTSDTESEGSSSSKKRGRPKKAAKVVEVDTTEDLFATLVSGARGPVVEEVKEEVQEVVVEVEEVPEVVEEVLPEVVVAEVVEEVQEVVEEVVAEVVEEVQEVVVEVQESSSGSESEGEKKTKTKKSKEEREAAKAEKEAKKAAKEAEKAAKAEAKAAKDAEKAAKAEAKAAKAAAKEKEEPVKIDEVAVVKVVEEELEEEEEEDEVAVEEFEFEGKRYLKSGNNVLYDMETQDEVGVWNEKEKKVEELQQESESDSE
jgi:hypothetical protein